MIAGVSSQLKLKKPQRNRVCIFTTLQADVTQENTTQLQTSIAIVVSA